MMDRDEYIARLKKSRRNMLTRRERLKERVNHSADLKFIETMTRKIELLNIIRNEIRVLIKQL
jgi:hypothetical protein